MTVGAEDRIRSTSCSYLLTNGPNKLESYKGENIANDKHSSLLDPFIPYEEIEVL